MLGITDCDVIQFDQQVTRRWEKTATQLCQKLHVEGQRKRLLLRMSHSCKLQLIYIVATEGYIVDQRADPSVVLITGQSGAECVCGG